MGDICFAIDGGSDYTIVVGTRPTRALQFAAAELQRYVETVCGARLPIEETAESKAVICIGEGAGPQPELDGLGEDAYVMRNDGARICLAGNSTRATLYAVYHFLEKYLGCGWCVPGDDAVPTTSTIWLNAFHDVCGPPAFSIRQLILFPYGEELLVLNNLPHTDWLTKNRLNWAHPAPNAPYVWGHSRSRAIFTPEVLKRGLYLQVGGHTFNTWLPDDRYAEEHPEYYALQEEGTRACDGSHKAGLCIGHPDVVEAVAENILKWLDVNPEVNAVDLWHNDSHTYCRCDRCTPAGLGEAESKIAYTRTYIAFANKVAARVAKRYPDVLVNLLAYFHTMVCPPDAERLSDNVLVGLCLFPRPGQRTMRPIETSDQHRDVQFRAQLATWPEVAERFYVYEYYTVGEQYKMWSMVSMMCEDLRYFRKLGIDGISSDQWGPGWYPLNMYAYGKLTWNPDLTPDEIIEDFCTRYYGGAADAMMDYWNLLEEGLRESWTTQDPIDWRDDRRRDVIRTALSQADGEAVARRVRAAATLHHLAVD